VQIKLHLAILCFLKNLIGPSYSRALKQENLISDSTNSVFPKVLHPFPLDSGNLVFRLASGEDGRVFSSVLPGANALTVRTRVGEWPRSHRSRSTAARSAWYNLVPILCLSAKGEKARICTKWTKERIVVTPTVVSLARLAGRVSTRSTCSPAPHSDR
jgi:hypothetical protein